MASRPFLECHVRRRVSTIGNVTILDGHDVVALVAADRDRVTGVRVVNRDGGAEKGFDADLVVDAMGRGAHTPAFLESLGYGRPVQDHIVTQRPTPANCCGSRRALEESNLVGPVPGRPTGEPCSAVRMTPGCSPWPAWRDASRRANEPT